MATWYSTLYKNQLNLDSTGAAAGGSNSVNYPQSRDAEGKIRVALVPYTVNGNEANGELIYLTRLPLKSKVLATHCHIIRQATGTALSISVGDSVDSVRYSNAADVHAAGDTAFTGGAGVATDQFSPSTIDAAANQDIIAKVVSPNTLTAASKILFSIAYVEPAG